MRPAIKKVLLGTVVVVAIAAAAIAILVRGDTAKLPEQASVGPNPTLPEPTRSLIPTVSIATARGWPAGATPKPAAGLSVKAYAGGFDHPRWLYVLPNGDVLVAETNAPARAERGIKGWIAGLLQDRAGAGVPSANRITLLRDADHDGIAELKTPFITGLNSPFGMVLVGQDLYVANTDAVVRFRYVDGATRIDTPGEKVVDLPSGPINHHWTKNLIASPDGAYLYATVGSNSNVGENGLDNEERRAAILRIDPAARQVSIFASGLRNPNGMAWQPETGVLWTVVNERDELGSDLVPDYLTSVKDGAFYGWPFSYWGQHVDDRVAPPKPDMVAKAIAPDYALGNHTASLGLAFAQGTLLPETLRNGAFIGQHGSWNRKPRSGYKVIFVPFAAGKPSGQPVDVLTGFLSDDDAALGRPVGVAIDRTGALLVADDVGNVIWRVTPAQAAATNR